GGEKGGVGKSLVSRALAQYFIDHSMPFVGFDTDRSHGALMRFYADYASPILIDRYEALDHIVEVAVEQSGLRVLVDLAAQTHAPLVAWMDDSGVLDLARENGLQITYWHVMDTGRDSVDLLRQILERFQDRLDYVVVRNQLRGNDFSNLEKSGLLDRLSDLGGGVIEVKQLHQSVIQKIDAKDSSFWAAKQSGTEFGAGLGLMERQRLKTWMNHVFAEFSAAGV
ncbi:MAG: mobilization protein, partial [Betaproteobacteria bacterium]|nr:mobilization protein [Betaproteobacteria bacterium]